MEEKLKYSKGDVVKINIKNDSPEGMTVEGFVDTVNTEDGSYDISIPDFATHGIEEKLNAVKEESMQPLFLTKDVQFLLSEGYSREEVFQSLDACNGDLDDALLFLHRNDTRNATLRSEGISEDFSHQRSSENCNYSKASNSTSQPSTSTSSVKEFKPSVKQLELSSKSRANSRTPSNGNPLTVPRATATYRKTSFCDDVLERGKLTLQPREDEFDYTVVFNEVPLGIEIHPCGNNRNACIGKTLNQFSKENVYKGSLILGCNDIWLLGQSTLYIQQCIKAEAQTTPVTISFRAKKWMTSQRARNLRAKLEKSRIKRANSLCHQKKNTKAHDHDRSKSDHFLSPRYCNKASTAPKIIRTRVPPSQRRKAKEIKIDPELRLFIIGGKFEFGITHVEAVLKNSTTLNTKKNKISRTPVIGESLTWPQFHQEADSSLTVKAMSHDKVIATGRISVPILPCTIKQSVDLYGNGLLIGKLNVRVTHIR